MNAPEGLGHWLAAGGAVRRVLAVLALIATVTTMAYGFGVGTGALVSQVRGLPAEVAAIETRVDTLEAWREDHTARITVPSLARLQRIERAAGRRDSVQGAILNQLNDIGAAQERQGCYLEALAAGEPGYRCR